MSGCRIGRVKLKGGATVIPMRQSDRDGIQRKIVEHAAVIAGNFEPGELKGYVIVGFDREASYSYGYQLEKDCVIGATLLPEWLADVMRRTFIEDGVWK